MEYRRMEQYAVGTAEDNTWTEGRIGLANYLADTYFDDFRIYGPGGAQAVEPARCLAMTWGNIK